MSILDTNGAQRIFACAYSNFATLRWRPAIPGTSMPMESGGALGGPKVNGKSTTRHIDLVQLQARDTIPPRTPLAGTEVTVVARRRHSSSIRTSMTVTETRFAREMTPMTMFNS